MVCGAAAAAAAGRATALMQANYAGRSAARASPASLAAAAEHGRMQPRHLPSGSSAARLGSTGRWRLRRICITGRSGSPRSRRESRPERRVLPSRRDPFRSVHSHSRGGRVSGRAGSCCRGCGCCHRARVSSPRALMHDDRILTRRPTGYPASARPGVNGMCGVPVPVAAAWWSGKSGGRWSAPAADEFGGRWVSVCVSEADTAATSVKENSYDP